MKSVNRGLDCRDTTNLLVWTLTLHCCAPYEKRALLVALTRGTVHAPISGIFADIGSLRLGRQLRAGGRAVVPDPGGGQPAYPHAGGRTGSAAVRPHWSSGDTDQRRYYPGRRCPGGTGRN